MSRPYLQPGTLDELRDLDDPAELDRVGRWIAWLLLHGYGVVSADVPPGFSSSNAHTVAAQLRDLGATTVSEPLKPGDRGHGPGAPTRLRMLTNHRGKAVRIASDDRPPVPATLAAREPRASAAPSTAVAVVRKPRAERPDPRLDLLRPAAPAPALGAPLRVVMIAETNGHPTIGLRDESGAVYFATLDGEPAR